MSANAIEANAIEANAIEASAIEASAIVKNNKKNALYIVYSIFIKTRAIIHAKKPPSAVNPRLGYNLSLNHCH